MTEAWPAMIEPEGLQRFRLGQPIGEGADLQVFAATDVATGDEVVVKRPHPSLVSRNIHDEVERQVALQVSLRSQDTGLVGLPDLYAVTGLDRFEWFFGDDLGHPYSVHIEARAAGVPLIGNISDQVRGLPVALPMNLFVLHPSTVHLDRNIRCPSLTVLDIIERCHELGFLAGDLGPRNVFYSPRSGQTTVVDLGALRQAESPATRRRQFDINDTLFEFFQFYGTYEAAPTSVEGYAYVAEGRHSGRLDGMAEALARSFASSTEPDQRVAAEAILRRIGSREYQTVPPFRRDFSLYLSGSAAKPRTAQSDELWESALVGLRDPYWTRFAFDARAELSAYP